MFLEAQTDTKPFREAVLHACLHNVAYEKIEDSRAPFLFDVIHATGEPDFYATRVCAALSENSLGDGQDEYQQCDLAGLLAKQGDEHARLALYAGFARSAAKGESAGEDALIALDGTAGYQFIAEQYSRYPRDFEDDWWDQAALRTFIDQVGEAQARLHTQLMRGANPALVPYLTSVWEKWDNWKADVGVWETARTRETAPNYETMRAAVNALDGVTVSRVRLKKWGKLADDDTVLRLAHDLLSETDDVRRLRLLHIFRDRLFPLEHAPLLAWAKHSDEKIARAAVQAVANVSHPDVRAFGLELTHTPTREAEGIALLVHNPGGGDVALVENLLRQAESDDTRHSIGLRARDYAEVNSSPFLAPLLITLYENTPCSLCRHHGVEMLLTLNAAPSWLAAEARYDADADTRALFAT